VNPGLWITDQARDTIEIEFDIVRAARGKNLFWIKRRLPTGQFREDSEMLLRVVQVLEES
jgi:hypothetical protein